mmetsp:Transcript_23151/g.75480  ORF Transcript_23151/g.75480 Transcript_23151/m.75480 type:complete len:207 (+) Transcript_23151:79-699(+)
MSNGGRRSVLILLTNRGVDERHERVDKLLEGDAPVVIPIHLRKPFLRRRVAVPVRGVVVKRSKHLLLRNLTVVVRIEIVPSVEGQLKRSSDGRRRLLRICRFQERDERHEEDELLEIDRLVPRHVRLSKNLLHEVISHLPVHLLARGLELANVDLPRFVRVHLREEFSAALERLLRGGKPEHDGVERLHRLPVLAPGNHLLGHLRL